MPDYYYPETDTNYLPEEPPREKCPQCGYATEWNLIDGHEVCGYCEQEHLYYLDTILDDSDGTVVSLPEVAAT